VFKTKSVQNKKRSKQKGVYKGLALVKLQIEG